MDQAWTHPGWKMVVMNPRMNWYENEHKRSLEHEARDPWQDFEQCNHGYF